MIQTIDSCLTTGSAASSSSTSAGSGVCGVDEVPAPASSNQVAEIPTPAYSDPDAKLVTIDVDGPAAPTRTTRSTGDPSRDTIESRSAPTPTTAPMVHAATVDIVSMLVAPAATDGTRDEQAISGAASTPATCSTGCLPRHIVAAPLLAASSTPTPLQCVLGTNTILVAAVPMAMTVEFLAVVAPMDYAPPGQLQQPYSDNELLRPSSSQRVTNKVLIHRPIPWPSLLAVQHNGDDTRPMPWPSYMEDYGCETPREVIMKLFPLGSSDSLRAEHCAAIELKISDSYGYGNLFTSTGCIIVHNMCISSELRYLDGVLLFLKYWWSNTNCVQSDHTTLVQLPCPISGFPLWVIARSLKLKLLSNGYASIRLLKKFWEVQISPDCFIAREPVIGVLNTMDWHLLGFPCRAAVPACLSCAQESTHYFCSSVVKELRVLNLMRSYPNFVLCDEWVLSPWDPGQAIVSDFATGQQAGFSYEQFPCANPNISCANQHTSYSPGHFVTSGQIQVTPACSTLHMFLSCFSPLFCLVLMLELHLVRNSSQCVYLQKLQMDTSELEGATLNSISINGTGCRSILAPTIISFAWDNLIYFSNSEMCAFVVGFLMIKSVWIKSEMSNTNISTHATHVFMTIQRSPSSTACSRISTMGLRSRGFQGVYAPIQSGSISDSTCAASYSQKNALYALACGLLFLQDEEGVDGLFDQENRVYASHATVCGSNKLELNNRVSYMMHFLGNSTSRAPMQGISLGNIGSYKVYAGHDVLIHGLLMQMLIGWPLLVHAKFIRHELSYEDNESCCFLCWYYGGSSLFLFLAFDKQEVFQGGRCAMISIIHYHVYDSYIDNLDYPGSNGLKVPRVSWDPGGSDLLHLRSRLGVKPYFKEGGVLGTRPCTSTWAWACLALGRSSWAGPSYLQPTGNTSRIRTATATASSWITERTAPFLSPFSLFPFLLRLSPNPQFSCNLKLKLAMAIVSEFL